MITKEKITKSELGDLAKKHFGRIDSYIVTENGHRIHVYTSLAKKTSPIDIRALGNMDHVHVATYVPYLKRGFIFTKMKKHVKNLPKKK